MDRPSKKTKPVGIAVPPVARHIGVSPALIYRWIEDEGIPALKIGHRYLLSRKVVEELLTKAGMPIEDLGL